MTTSAQEHLTSETVTSRIMEHLSTRDDVIKLSEACDILKEALYKTGKSSPLEKINEYIPQTFAEIMTASLTQETQDPSSVEVSTLLQTIKEAIEHMKAVSVTVAIEPPKNTILRLSEWVKKTYGDQMLMEFTIDPHIIGGAIIIHNGNYLDLSLKKKLHSLFETRKSDIEKHLLASEVGQKLGQKGGQSL